MILTDQEHEVHEVHEVRGCPVLGFST
jgi:hypothetical protein